MEACASQGRRDSNPQPAVLETAALPVELLPFGVVMHLAEGATNLTRPLPYRIPGKVRNLCSDAHTDEVYLGSQGDTEPFPDPVADLTGKIEDVGGGGVPTIGERQHVPGGQPRRTGSVTRGESGVLD